jgi:hypothetical protein
LSLSTNAHPLHTRFPKIIGASISEATMRPNPRSRAATSGSGTTRVPWASGRRSGRGPRCCWCGRRPRRPSCSRTCSAWWCAPLHTAPDEGPILLRAAPLYIENSYGKSEPCRNITPSSMGTPRNSLTYSVPPFLKGRAEPAGGRGPRPAGGLLPRPPGGGRRGVSTVERGRFLDSTFTYARR